MHLPWHGSVVIFFFFRYCSMVLQEENWMPKFSLVQHIINDSSTWWMIKFILVPEDQYKYWPDNLWKADQGLVDFSSGSVVQ